MNIKKLTADSSKFPEALRRIPKPPVAIYVATNNWGELLARPCVAVIGSRKVTPYGRAVTTQLAGELARAGVVIVSGLAIGVDAIAHRAALDAGGLTIAVLPSGLDAIYPRLHRNLAAEIVERGGALVTEYPQNTPIYKGNFIARSRIVAGLSRITLITEAAQKSGTLHTAQFALEQGKDVMAVPGNITSPTSAGTNSLIKDGAALVTEAADVLHALGIRPTATRTVPQGDTPEQQRIIDLIAKGESDGAVILRLSGMDISVFNQSITMLEITGKIRSLGENKWALA